MTPRSVASTALRYFHTIRALRAEQIVFRVLHEGRERARHAGIVPERTLFARRAMPPQRRLSLGGTADLRSSLETARAEAAPALAGRFEFGAFTMHIEPTIDWRPVGASRLARYHLHYLDVLEPLAALVEAGDPGARSTGDHLVRSWIRDNAFGVGEGWEPYPASTRLANLVCWSLVSDTVPGEALVEHARWTASHLERHLLGNHLVRNLAALALAALRFDGPEAEAWRAKSFGVLERELADQVLSDGGHHERSPMYQLVVLNDLLRVAALARRVDLATPAWFDDALRRMTAWSTAMRHPDGEIPLLNDAAIGQAPHPSEVLSLAASLQLGPPVRAAHPWRAALWAREVNEASRDVPPDAASVLEPSGYTVVRRADDALFFDHGPIGPPHLLGHAHSDTLGFELSLAGKRIVVDGGVAGYDADPLRPHLRSASAHSVVTVDGEGPDEMWKTFRVARRSQPGRYTLRKNADVIVLSASLASPFGWSHRRSIVWMPGEGMIILDDVECTRLDANVMAQIQLHPDVVVRGDADAFVARRDNVEFAVRVPGGHATLRVGTSAAHDAWVAERFGQPRATTQIRYPLERRRACYAAVAFLDWSGRLGSRVVVDRDRVVVSGLPQPMAFVLGDRGWHPNNESA